MMGGGVKPLTGPDLTGGVKVGEISDGGLLLGHAHGKPVVLARRGSEVFAVGATCSHYSGPLNEGLLVGHQVRCPWHHACFDVRTGEAVGAPAFNSIPCFAVEVRDGRAFVREEKQPPAREAKPAPSTVVIVGAGAAGHACAEMLRSEGHAGRILLVGEDPAPPVDRPNLSKDYLAGTAPEDWVPMRPVEYYAQQKIELHTGVRVTALDAKARTVTLSDGRTQSWDALVLAPGATPNRLAIPGGERALLLRTLADSRAIIARAATAKSAVVIGASFIGLEVAASLRTRNLAVRVVAPDPRPLQKVLGPELGDFVRALHVEHGVEFHLQRKPASIADGEVTLDDGTILDADLVVAGVGVRPNLDLAERAGLALDRGIVVDEQLRTSAPGVWAAGDVARWPDPRWGTIRVEHWVLAQRQGQSVARSLLGAREPFRTVPFFWSQHYDVPINYVGHAEKWDASEVHGSIANKSCVVAYRVGGKVRAAASIYRDGESLAIEAALERDDQPAIEKILQGVK
jgi:NADPH-dependent 2,4-dienoyl-CoA reductase/sulfur reductase-like enzyme/nitrite reductase/ring-hydroxylating ferredoxin subunit